MSRSKSRMECLGCGKQVVPPYKPCECGAHAITDGTSGYITMTPQMALMETAMGLVGIPRHNWLHLDEIVGASDHTSRAKTAMINELKTQGFHWIRDCQGVPLRNGAVAFPPPEPLKEADSKAAVAEYERMLREQR